MELESFFFTDAASSSLSVLFLLSNLVVEMLKWLPVAFLVTVSVRVASRPPVVLSNCIE